MLALSLACSCSVLVGLYDVLGNFLSGFGAELRYGTLELACLCPVLVLPAVFRSVRVLPDCPASPLFLAPGLVILYLWLWVGPVDPARAPR